MLEIGDPYALIEYNGRQGYAASSFLTPTEEHLASQAQADAQAQAAATQAQASNHDFFPSMWSGGLGTTGEATYRGYPVKIIDHSFVYVPIIDAGDMTREELIEARDKLAVLGPHPDQLRVSIAQGGARSQLNRLVLIGVAFAAGLAIARVLK